MVRLFEKTNYTKIFKNSYWGWFEYTDEFFTIIENRNMFIENYDIKSYQKNYQSIYRPLKKDIYKCEVCNKGFIYPYLLDAHYNKPIHIKMVFKELPNNI